jgi:GDPmannose 4,6-dehydratase
MWRMLQVDGPDDYVVGTGEINSVRMFLEVAMNYAGIEIEWKGRDIEEQGLVKSRDPKWASAMKPGDVVVRIDPRYFRPIDVPALQADIRKAKSKLNWSPKLSFVDLVKVMIDHDLAEAGLETKAEGFATLRRHGYLWTSKKSIVPQHLLGTAGRD